MMANNGKVLLVIKCTEDKIQYMWNDVMVYIYENNIIQELTHPPAVPGKRV